MDPFEELGLEYAVGLRDFAADLGVYENTVAAAVSRAPAAPAPPPGRRPDSS